ncbi:MAG: glucosaminidase domain-containing protein [Helicobacteraceae bacterium]|jgi:Bax protein|nr:glucosaminidase domain-containing protein [Helicobacteraceae bacterium]
MGFFKNFFAKIGEILPEPEHKTHLPWWSLIAIILTLFALAAPAYLYWFGGLKSFDVLKADIEYRSLGDHTEIEELNYTAKTVKPVLYLNSPDLKDLNVTDRKDRFIAMLLPSILLTKLETQNKLAVIEKIMKKRYPSRKERQFVRNVFNEYTSDNERRNKTEITFEELKKRMLLHPNSVALAQAALESGWGTSHTFLQSNNLFGVWSFKTSEPRHHSQTRPGGFKVYVRKYDSIYASVRDYFNVIAVSRAFDDFRNARMDDNDSKSLVGYLLFYSEQRKEYIGKLRNVINHNDLQEFDDFQIDSRYLQTDKEF